MKEKNEISKLVATLALGLGVISLAHGAPNVTVNAGQDHQKRLNYKRGALVTIERNDNNTKSRINNVAAAKLDMVNFTFNLVDNQNGKSNEHMHQPLDMFYKNNDGSRGSRVDADLTAIRKYAKNNKGLELIMQVSGGPYYGTLKVGRSNEQRFRDQSVFNYPNNQNYGPGAVGGNLFPLPVPNQQAAFGNLLGNWMRKVENAFDGDTIWIGTQEPTHTLGFPNGNKSKAAKEANVRDYVSVWKNITSKIRGYKGAKTAGLQYNSGTSFIAYILNQLRSQNVKVDYISYQSYRSDEFNKSMLNTTRTSMNTAANKAHFKGTKVLFNRYSYWKDQSNNETKFNRSQGIIRFLNAEQALANNSDLVYGYVIQQGTMGKGYMLEAVMKFLQTMPAARKTASTQQGLKVIAAGNTNQIKIAVWNPSTVNRTVEIKINNAPAAIKNSNMSVMVGNGANYQSKNANRTSSGSSVTIKGFSLPKKAFALISL